MVHFQDFWSKTYFRSNHMCFWQTILKNQFQIIFGIFHENLLYFWAHAKTLTEISKKGPFSLNQVGKMTNKTFFPIKSKMFPVWDFHISFQFRPKKWLPRDLWILQTPRKRNQAGSTSSLSDFQFFWLRELLLVVIRCWTVLIWKISTFGHFEPP